MTPSQAATVAAAALSSLASAPSPVTRRIAVMRLTLLHEACQRAGVTDWPHGVGPEAMRQVVKAEEEESGEAEKWAGWWAEWAGARR